LQAQGVLQLRKWRRVPCKLNLGNSLNRVIIGDDHVIVPELEGDKFAQKPWAYNLEFASKDMASA
jgi:hypothetical protein